MRTSVARMLEKHSPLFNGMVTRVKVLQNGSDLSRGFAELCEELFQRDEVSWAKIVALFAFAARLALHCSEHADLGGDARVFDVASALAQFAVERLTPFLQRNGGWVRKEILILARLGDNGEGFGWEG